MFTYRALDSQKLRSIFANSSIRGAYNIYPHPRISAMATSSGTKQFCAPQSYIYMTKKTDRYSTQISPRRRIRSVRHRQIDPSQKTLCRVPRYLWFFDFSYGYSCLAPMEYSMLILMLKRYYSLPQSRRRRWKGILLHHKRGLFETRQREWVYRT